MAWKTAKTVGVQFAKGILDVLLGLYHILMGHIDALAGQVAIQRQRAAQSSRTPSPPRSRLLQDRMKRKRAAEAAAATQSESDGSAERQSPAARRQLGVVGRFIFQKIPMARQFVCRNGTHYLGQCRFTVFACCVLYAFLALFSFATSASPEDGVVLTTVKYIFAAIYYVLLLVGSVSCMLLSGDVSNLAQCYRKKLNLPTRQFRDHNSVSSITADIIVSLLTLQLLGAQVAALKYIPIPLLSSVIITIAHSLYFASYAFEYRYLNQGMGQATRYQRMEDNWAYYAGFGFPLALLSYSIANSTVSGCVGPALLPVLIVSAYVSEPDARMEDVPRLPFAAIPMAISESVSTWISRRLTDRIPGRATL